MNAEEDFVGDSNDFENLSFNAPKVAGQIWPHSPNQGKMTFSVKKSHYGYGGTILNKKHTLLLLPTKVRGIDIF